MAIYTDTLPPIEPTKVKNFLAARGQNKFTEPVIADACRQIEQVATPQGIFRQGFYDAASAHFLCDHSFKIQSRQLLPLLADAAILIAGVVTLGSAVQACIDERFLAKDFSRGIVLDAAAGVALQLYVEQFTQTLNELVRDKNYRVTLRFIPGTGDWPLQQQVFVAQAAGGEEIGIGVTSGGLLTPRKSQAALFCLRADGSCSGSGCAGCALSGGCCGN